jgi:hypothetical protein
MEKLERLLFDGLFTYLKTLKSDSTVEVVDITVAIPPASYFCVRAAHVSQTLLASLHVHRIGRFLVLHFCTL